MAHVFLRLQMSVSSQGGLRIAELFAAWVKNVHPRASAQTFQIRIFKCGAHESAF